MSDGHRWRCGGDGGRGWTVTPIIIIGLFVLAIWSVQSVSKGVAAVTEDDPENVPEADGCGYMAFGLALAVVLILLVLGGGLAAMGG